jgi:hypothetical protein
VPVHRHDEQVDAGVQEFVGHRPRNAVDVVLAGDRDRPAHDVLQVPFAGQQAADARPVDRRADVPAQRGQPDPALDAQVLEPDDLVRGRVGQPAAYRLGRLAGPLWPVVLRQLRRSLQPVQSLGDVLGLQPPQNRLGVRVADIEVAVVQDEYLLDAGVARHYLVAPVVNPATNCFCRAR